MNIALSLKIRKHEDNDIDAQTELVNEVISEVDPKFAIYTAEKIKEEYDEQDPKFCADQVYYLVDKVIKL